MNDDSIAAIDLLEEMTPLVQEALRAEQHRERYEGIGFSIAEYAVRRSEVPLNRIIGDLLEPRGPHGQGGQFLQLFLGLVDPDILLGQPTDWDVRVNHPTRKGRYVDIGIIRRNEIAIYIESKPWAMESDEQLEDYAADLLALTCQQKRLVFLPGTSDQEIKTLSPTTRNLLGKRLIRMPFQYSETASSIVQWLEQCAQICEAENVRLFITDLRDYLRGQFPSVEERFMCDDPFVLAMLPQVRNNESYMATIFKVALLAGELKRDLTASFFQDLADKLPARKAGWVVENNFRNINSSDGEQHQHLFFRAQSWPKHFAICLEGRPVVREFCIGFRCPPETRVPNTLDAFTTNDRLILRGALDQPLRTIGSVRAHSWWPAWCYLPDPFQNWRDETFLLISGVHLMPDGRTAIDTFVEWFLFLANAVESKIDEIQASHNHG